jgi:hypothetical protein
MLICHIFYRVFIEAKNASTTLTVVKEHRTIPSDSGLENCTPNRMQMLCIARQEGSGYIPKDNFVFPIFLDPSCDMDHAHYRPTFDLDKSRRKSDIPEKNLLKVVF